MLDNNNHLPYEYITKLLNDLGKSPSFKWLTYNIVNKAFLQFKANLEEEKRRGKEKELFGMGVDISTADNSALLSDLSGDVPVKCKSAESVSSLQVRSKGGRHVGSTKKAKEDKQKMVFQAKNVITKRFLAVKRKCSPKGKIKDGNLVKIINEVKEEICCTSGMVG